MAAKRARRKKSDTVDWIREADDLLAGRCQAEVEAHGLAKGGAYLFRRRCLRPGSFGVGGLFCGVHARNLKRHEQRALVQAAATKADRSRLDAAFVDRAGECPECGYIVSHAGGCSVGAQAARLAHKEAAKAREVVECKVRVIIPDKNEAFEVDAQMTREQLDKVQRAHARDQLMVNWIKGV